MPTRRTVLAALGAAALTAGCSTPSRPDADPTTSASPTSTTPRPSATTPTATRSAPTSHAAASRPTRADVVARFAARKPTEWGLHSPGTLNETRSQLVALTFDACGGKGGAGYDKALVEVLRRRRVPATLMLNTRWIAANASVAQELAADPLFEIQSHGARHLPLSVSGAVAYGSTGFRSVGEVYDEVAAGIDGIGELTGKPARFFRPGTAFCDEVAAEVARLLGAPIVDFSVNGDAGTTFRVPAIVRSVGAVKAGDIVIGHMNHPEHWTAKGFDAVLPTLLDRGIRFGHLTQVA